MQGSQSYQCWHVATECFRTFCRVWCTLLAHWYWNGKHFYARCSAVGWEWWQLCMLHGVRGWVCLSFGSDLKSHGGSCGCFWCCKWLSVGTVALSDMHLCLLELARLYYCWLWQHFWLSGSRYCHIWWSLFQGWVSAAASDCQWAQWHCWNASLPVGAYRVVLLLAVAALLVVRNKVLSFLGSLFQGNPLLEVW